MLAAVRKLAPDIVSRAGQIEALRHLPTDLVEGLRAIGIFRMLVPQSHSGLELELPSALEISRALARIEPSSRQRRGAFLDRPLLEVVSNQIPPSSPNKIRIGTTALEDAEPPAAPPPPELIHLNANQRKFFVERKSPV